MKLCWMLVAGLAWAGAVAAEPGELTESPRCREALVQLERQEAGVRERAASAAEPLRQARREAAIACLRGPADATPAHSVRPPVTVTSPAVPGAQPVPVAPPRPAVPRPAAPTTITTCDAVGCWTNDGTRLQRAGPGLVGPRGPCTAVGAAVGAIVSCP